MQLLQSRRRFLTTLSAADCTSRGSGVGARGAVGLSGGQKRALAAGGQKAPKHEIAVTGSAAGVPQAMGI